MYWLANVLFGTQARVDPHADYDLYLARAHRERAGAARHLAHGLGGRFATAPARIRALAARYTRWRAERIAIRQLHGLSDDMLRDIGLSRGDVLGAVRGLVRRSPDGAVVRPAARRRARPASPARPEMDWRRAA